MTGQAVQPYMERFGALRSELPGAGLAWLEELREAGMDRFQRLGWPTKRVEASRFTGLKPLQKEDFRPVSEVRVPTSLDPVPSLLAGNDRGARMVFVNGACNAGLTRTEALPDGFAATALGDTLENGTALLEGHLGRIGQREDQPLYALNTAMMDDGFVLRLGRGCVAGEPLEIIFAGGLADRPVAYHPRNLIVLEEGAEATLVEHHLGLGAAAYFANGATEIHLGPGAVLHHYKVQAEGDKGLHVATTHVHVGQDARYDSFGFSIGARLSRNEVTARLAGSGSSCRLSGSYLLRGEQHCDNTTLIEHLVPRTSSRELFKGVVGEKAHAVFQGKIYVARDAQQTDGYQLSNALILNDGAEVSVKPELEIYADDVRCSHGATVAQLDHDALFYLRSRGLSHRRARNLMIRSFLAGAMEEVTSEPLREALMNRYIGWLEETAL